MPDMTNLPDAPEPERTDEDVAALDRLRAEVEALRLRTPEANAEYWRSDEAMEND